MTAIGANNARNASQSRPNLDFDPAPSWGANQSPGAGFLLGARDKVVPIQQSAERIVRALMQAKNADVTIKVYLDADHTIKLRLESGPIQGASGTGLDLSPDTST